MSDRPVEQREIVLHPCPSKGCTWQSTAPGPCTRCQRDQAEARIESLESGLRGLTETLERFGQLKIDAWRGEQKAAIKLGRDLLHGNQTKE